MFVIKPIKDIELHKEVCNKTGCEYCPGTLAYFAAELKDDSKTIDRYIGICQFIPGEISRIVSLVSTAGYEKDEAMIILCRTVMSFLSRAGSVEMYMPNTAGPEEILKNTGLIKTTDGYKVDLDEFYKSPCKYNKEHNNG